MIANSSALACYCKIHFPILKVILFNTFFIKNHFKLLFKQVINTNYIIYKYNNIFIIKNDKITNVIERK